MYFDNKNNMFIFHIHNAMWEYKWMCYNEKGITYSGIVCKYKELNWYTQGLVQNAHKWSTKLIDLSI